MGYFHLLLSMPGTPSSVCSSSLNLVGHSLKYHTPREAAHTTLGRRAHHSVSFPFHAFLFLCSSCNRPLNPSKGGFFSRCSTEHFTHRFSEPSEDICHKGKCNCSPKELFSFKSKSIVKMGNFASGKHGGFCNSDPF